MSTRKTNNIADLIRKQLLKEAKDNPVLNSPKAIGLSKFDKDFASNVVTGGFNDADKQDDVIDGGPDSIPVSQLKPAQKEVIVSKAVAFALGYAFNNFKEVKAKNGAPDLANMEAIVSNDDFIMDGHHRWAAATLLSPSAKVSVTKLDLPGQELVTALNAMTKGKLGIDVGNKGRGDVANFTGDKVQNAIKYALKDGTEQGLKQWPHLSAEEVKQALGKVPGANGDSEKGMAIMADNAGKLVKQKMQGAPERKDMPVIDAEKVKDVVGHLNKGTADVLPPYSNKVQSNLKESFQRRAGIKK
tara:strand:+ start:868 stop:1770 length:903 start_codon:yes stop_codon:yes gene_type:complete